MKQREAGAQDVFLGLTADIAVASTWLVTSGATPGPRARIPTQLPRSGQHIIATRRSNACAQPVTASGRQVIPRDVGGLVWLPLSAFLKGLWGLAHRPTASQPFISHCFVCWALP